MALTPKQEHFCRLIASGKDYTTAYLTAYDWNGSNNGAKLEAMKLANREEIQEKIQTLTKPLQLAAQTQVLTERTERIEYIKGRIAHCEAVEDEQSLIRWNDMLCKILSLYRDNDPEQSKEHSVTNLDTDTLIKLSGAS